MWCGVLAVSWMQVTRQFYAVEFSTSSSLMAFSASDNAPFQLSYDTSYGVMLWVKWGLPPSASSVVAKLDNGPQLLLSITQGTDGRWTVSAASISGLETVISSVLSTSVWTHIGVSVCSVTGLLSLHVTQWQGVATSYSTSTSSFKSLDPGHTTLTLGSGVVGQILDCRMSTSCLDLSDITPIVALAACHDQCPGNCFGPGDRSCNTYIQLTDEQVPWTLDDNYYQWARDDPHLQGHTFNSYSYSFTGWFFHTTTSAVVNIFRSQNIPGNCCTVGERVFTIFIFDGLYFAVDFNSLADHHNTLLITVRNTQSSILNKWMFVGASLSPALKSVCYAFFPEDGSTHCTTFPTPSTDNQMWGSATTSALFIGDPYYTKLTGEIADVRYYFSGALSVTEMEALYQAKIASLRVVCASMTSSFECYQLCTSCSICTSEASSDCPSCAPSAPLQGTKSCLCEQGFFPSPNALQCSPCIPTCLTCSEAFECLSCKSNAQLHQGICECVSAFIGSPDASNCISCSQGCVSCTLDKCLSCSSEYILYEDACISSCPSGFIRASNGSGCEVAHYPIPQLIVQPNNSLTIQFDKPMNATLNRQDISVNVTYQSDQLSVYWAAPLFTTNQTLLISLHFAKQYIPSDTVVLFIFKAPDKVIDFQNLGIKEPVLNGTLFAVGSPPSNNSSLLQSSLTQQTTAVAAGALAANLVSSAFSGSLVSILTTFSQFQLIAYLCLSPVPISEHFAEALAAININIMLPNPLINILYRNYSSQASSSTAVKIGIDTTLLLPNIVSIVSISLLVLLTYVPLKLGAMLGLEAFSPYCERALLAFKCP